MPALDRYSLALKFFPESADHLLDIGSSDGSFVKQLVRGTGAQIDIIEPSPSASLVQMSREYAERVVLHSTPLESAVPSGARYDVVTLLDVFEHVTDEQKFADEVVRRVRPGGLIILSVPHVCWYDFLDPANVLSRLRSDSEWHRHYRVEQLLAFFGDAVEVCHIRRQGTLWGVLIKYALHYRLLAILPVWFTRLRKKIERRDYARSWGRASYHLLLVLKKKDCANQSIRVV